MATINVTKSFLLNTVDAGIIKFDVGNHDVDEKTAEHWYVKAHSSLVEIKSKVPTDEELKAQAEAEAAAKAEAEKKAAEEAEAALKAQSDDLADNKTTPIKSTGKK